MEPITEKFRKTWRSKAFWITAILLMVAMAFGQNVLEKKRLTKNLHRIARAANKTTPVMIDTLMRLDSLSVVGDNALQYHYRFIHNDRSEIDTGVLHNYYRPHMIGVLRSEPKLKYLREHDVFIEMKYVDRNNQLISLEKIQPGDYQVK